MLCSFIIFGSLFVSIAPLRSGQFLLVRLVIVNSGLWFCKTGVLTKLLQQGI